MLLRNVIVFAAAAVCAKKKEKAETFWGHFSSKKKSRIMVSHL